MTPREVAASFTSPGADFGRMQEAVLQFQLRQCPVYRRYAASLGDPTERSFHYLPIEAFKMAAVTTFPPEEAEAVFESSGTGRGGASRHYVRDLSVYRRSAASAFEMQIGPGPFVILAHLPHYERQGVRSSLLFMVRHLMETFGAAGSAFFMDEPLRAIEAGIAASGNGAPLLLFGAAFGLADVAEEMQIKLPPDAHIIETGGMKTYRRDTDRASLHALLSAGFGVPEAQIGSEYGMCELLSQCYARTGPVYQPPPWVSFEVVSPEYPHPALPEGQPGALAVFDLANVYSVSAILTQDRAVRRGNGFEILGRLSGAELRGCNFLVERAENHA